MRKILVSLALAAVLVGCAGAVKQGGVELRDRYPDKAEVVEAASSMSRAVARTEIGLSVLGEIVADAFEQCLGARSVDPNADCLVEQDDAREVKTILDQAQPVIDEAWGAITDYLSVANNENYSAAEKKIALSKSFHVRVKRLAIGYGLEVPN